MISYHQFNNMPVQEQLTTVLGQGIDLLERVYVYYIIKLYKLDDLYIEIWYKQTTNRIDKVKVVDLNDVIHLYESQINISDLFV